MTIFVNMLLSYKAEDKFRTERVLWIDPTGREVVTIDADEAHTRVMPVRKAMAELVADIESGYAVCCDATSTDELSGEVLGSAGGRVVVRLPLPNPEIDDKYKKIREKNWSLIAPLISTPNGEIFDRKIRGRLIEQQEINTGKNRKVIYALLRRFWQRGQTKNALIPDYHKCGTVQGNAGTDKRGRRSKLVVLTGGPPGINVDEHVLSLIMKGAHDFYLTSHEPSFERAYDLTMTAYFCDHHEVVNGVQIPILVPASERPTVDQFRYWVTKETNPVVKHTKRSGHRDFMLNHRAVLGDSTQGVFGPGTEYQIDSTIGDIHLVSAFDRKRIIGRPVIYFVEDTFSRLIAGFSATLEGPSWVGAMIALENATTDKVEFCAAHGIEITPAQWPSHGLPQQILADRGEMEGYNADNLVNGLNIQISNTPPYRADMKGIIERNFRIANDRSIRWLPGAVSEHKQRGGPDDRLDACLTLFELRQILIRMILYHNNAYRMDTYPMHPEMVSDGVKPYPRDIWEWGIANRTGALRIADRETIRLNLLPFVQDGASVTGSGILFKNLHYTCEAAQAEHWFVIARERGRFRVSVVHDPRDVNTIYLVLKDRHQMVTCHLLEKDSNYRNSDWYDVLDYFERLKLASIVSRSSDEQARAEFQAHVDAIVDGAKSEAANNTIELSAAARTKGIADNRRQERTEERSAMAWQFAGSDGAKPLPESVGSELGPVTQSATDGYVGRAKYTDMLREMLEDADKRAQDA